MERDQDLHHEEPSIRLYPKGNKNDGRDLLVIYTQIFLLV